MRVLMDYRAALRARSGVGEYAHEIARALLKVRAPECSSGAAVDLTLFSSSWKDRVVQSAELAGATIVDRRVPVSVLNFAWHRLQWPPIEALAAQSFDVAHSLHPLLMPARNAAQVITIYDLNFLKHPERTTAEIRRDYPVLVRDHAARADHVVVISQFTAREAHSLLGVDPERVSIARPGAPAWPVRSQPPGDQGYILFFGTLEPRKNVGVLLDAYEQIRRRRRDFPPLVLAGKATAGAAPWLERIARAPLSGWVRHVGYVDPDRRRELYAQARLLVHPALEEGFGMTVLEAMTVGVPVVASDRGALPEVVGDAGVLVNPDNAEALAAAIERTIDDQALADRLSAAGPVRARDFSWDRAAAVTLAAYQSAVDRRSARRGAA